MNTRTRSAIITTVLHAALGYALLAGFGVVDPAATVRELALIDVTPLSPPPPPPPPKIRQPEPEPKAARREGEAAPPNIRSKPTEIVAPKPVVPLPVPPQVVVAPVAAQGRDVSAGAAPYAGPGIGAGGVGNGFGGGGAGDGDGDGGYGSPPRQRGGRIRDRDFPAAAADAGASGTVSVKYRVLPDGRVGECMVTGSSGSPLLDATTCRLIQERFRFEPSRDARGRPVASWIVEDHSWQTQRVPAER